MVIRQPVHALSLLMIRVSGSSCDYMELFMLKHNRNYALMKTRYNEFLQRARLRKNGHKVLVNSHCRRLSSVYNKIET